MICSVQQEAEKKDTPWGVFTVNKEESRYLARLEGERVELVERECLKQFT
jgi:hypothetical protein